MDQHRVDRAATIVDRGIGYDLHESRFRIDLHLADGERVGERRDVHDLIADTRQRTPHFGRQRAAGSCGCGFEQTNRTVGACHDKALTGEFDIGLGDFQHCCGNPAALFDDLVGGLGDLGLKSRGLRPGCYSSW
jgi:hypothetical protein